MIISDPWPLSSIIPRNRWIGSPLKKSVLLSSSSLFSGKRDHEIIPLTTYVVSQLWVLRMPDESSSNIPNDTLSDRQLSSISEWYSNHSKLSANWSPSENLSFSSRQEHDIIQVAAYFASQLWVPRVVDEGCSELPSDTLFDPFLSSLGALLHRSEESRWIGSRKFLSYLQSLLGSGETETTHNLLIIRMTNELYRFKHLFHPFHS